MNTRVVDPKALEVCLDSVLETFGDGPEVRWLKNRALVENLILKAGMFQLLGDWELSLYTEEQTETTYLGYQRQKAVGLMTVFPTCTSDAAPAIRYWRLGPPDKPMYLGALELPIYLGNGMNPQVTLRFEFST